LSTYLPIWISQARCSAIPRDAPGDESAGLRPNQIMASHISTPGLNIRYPFSSFTTDTTIPTDLIQSRSFLQTVKMGYVVSLPNVARQLSPNWSCQCVQAAASPRLPNSAELELTFLQPRRREEQGTRVPALLPAGLQGTHTRVADRTDELNLRSCCINR
jgi:hypothetical protein